MDLETEQIFSGLLVCGSVRLWIAFFSLFFSPSNIVAELEIVSPKEECGLSGNTFHESMSIRQCYSETRAHAVCP